MIENLLNLLAEATKEGRSTVDIRQLIERVINPEIKRYDDDLKEIINKMYNRLNN